MCVKSPEKKVEVDRVGEVKKAKKVTTRFHFRSVLRESYPVSYVFCFFWLEQMVVEALFALESSNRAEKSCFFEGVVLENCKKRLRKKRTVPAQLVAAILSVKQKWFIRASMCYLVLCFGYFFISEHLLFMDFEAKRVYLYSKSLLFAVGGGGGGEVRVEDGFSCIKA